MHFLLCTFYYLTFKQYTKLEISFSNCTTAKYLCKFILLSLFIISFIFLIFKFPKHRLATRGKACSVWGYNFSYKVKSPGGVMLVPASADRGIRRLRGRSQEQRCPGKGRLKFGGGGPWGWPQWYGVNVHPQGRCSCSIFGFFLACLRTPITHTRLIASADTEAV